MKAKKKKIPMYGGGGMAKMIKMYLNGGKLTEEEKKALAEAAKLAAKQRKSPSAENPSPNTPAPKTKPLNRGEKPPISSPEGSIPVSEKDKIILRGMMSKLK